MAPLSFPKRKIEQARKLRREMTIAERKLRFALRDYRLAGLKFRRQHAIGPYIADFSCPEVRLVVEVDGEQHSHRVEYDEERTRFLGTRGCRVVRFGNVEVLENIDGVVDGIWTLVKERQRHVTLTREACGLATSPSEEGEEK